MVGDVLYGTYRILDVLGKGGSGTVYLARHERGGRLWAVKEMADENNRLIMEAELLKKLHHPGLPVVGDVLGQNGVLYLVMDYIEGRSLKEILDLEKTCSQEQAVDWGLQLCAVLSYLHTRTPAVIYRDMKPSNVMQREDGSLVLVDFGTAREQKEEADGDTVWLGTRGYAAPEQYGGYGQTGPQTDVYGLGAVLYHLLTGYNPADPPYRFLPVRSIRPELSGGLEKILQCCTREDPAKRYSSCKELAWALEHYRELDEEYIRQRKRKKKIFTICAAVTAMSFAGSLAMDFLEQRAVADTYQARISEAQWAIGAENRMAACRRAISLEPGLSAGYECLFKIFLEDGGFSAEEELLFREILNERKAGGKTFLEYLESEKGQYRRAAYGIGQAYFYDYEEVDGKRASLRWLLAAAEAEPGEGLSEREVFRARILSKIAEYYDGLDIQRKNGDTEASYGEYWDDLRAISDQEVERRDNRTTALLADRELTVQLALRVEQFKKAGVSRDSMEEALSDVEKRMEKWDQEKEGSEYEAGLRQEVKDGLSAAKRALEAAFLAGEEEHGTGNNQDIS